MTGALIILAALVVVGAVLYVHHRITEGRAPSDADAMPTGEASDAAATAADDGCCGMHITCERDSLLAAVSPDVVYYDDEELDAFAGRAADSYTPEEADRFRDVLLTLLPQDIAGWARSIQLRGIALPADVRDELLLIVAEARAASVSSH